jgi:DNA polymerase (family 10)
VVPPVSSLRLPLGRAHLIASLLERDAQRAGLEFETLVPVGSLRRYSPDVGDVTQLALAPRARHERLLDAFGRLSTVSAVVSRGAGEITVATERGAVRVVLAAPEDAGAALVWHTGARAHVSHLQSRARALGLTFADGRVARGATPLPTPGEADLYAHFDLPFIPPELREGADEIEAAGRGLLPDLITATRIRGDLHVHSLWSDGRDTIEEMVLAARRLGYDYLAVTDHSERSWSSRAVSRADVPRQREEIEVVQEKYPDITILHGLEVEIMPDGSLDFDDDLLAEFEVVLASLHDPAGHSAARLMRRYLGAIRHPLVNVITHPANRSPAGSPGYDLDFDLLFAAAAEAGTALEVDGSPSHLDMDGALARRAMASTASIVVNSDCHRSDALARQMRFGIGTARRGWVEPHRVLNTGTIDDVRAFVARKRRGASA